MNQFSNFPNRDKAVLIGLYLSKFDKKALDEFGFTGFRQAYNVLGYSLGVIPKSIQNYRDEFDPYFPNSRQGWRGRKLRDYCKEIMLQADTLDFDKYTSIVKDFIITNNDLEKLSKKQDTNKSIANRLITGRAAEEYFRRNHTNIDIFKGLDMFDTTYLGCGFDFKLSSSNQFFCVEVKGLNDKTGSVLMTEKEFDIASSMRDKYCLFVVKNFRERPEHQFFLDPLNSSLTFKEQKRHVIQTSYSTWL